jgi:hypothetical protein
MLRNEMHVGAGIRKPMADCTIDDLRFCVDERGQTVNRIEEQMSNLRALIDMMVQRGARTVSDLPEQQQWKTMTLAQPSKPGHRVHDTQRDFAGPTNTPPATSLLTPKEVAPAGPGHPPATSPLPPNRRAPAGPILADPMLGLFADVVDDLETVRIANQNRLRQLCDDTEHGHGLTVDHPQVRILADLVASLEASEHQAVLALKRAMRAHPLGPWVKNTPGVGEKQAARLIAAIRDPYWNDLHGRPRTVSELWSYCGFSVVHTGDHRVVDPQEVNVAGVAPRRARGTKATWNQNARMRAYLVAVSCVKVAQSPYRDVYDTGRIKYAESVHAAACVRCGPSGHPAALGTPLSLGHQHARAMRLMCKEILRDLWREAARIHQATDTTN